MMHRLCVHPRPCPLSSQVAGSSTSSASSSDFTPPADSLAKLQYITALCHELGVVVEPMRIGRLWIVPLLAWHHQVGISSGSRNKSMPQCVLCHAGRGCLSLGKPSPGLGTNSTLASPHHQNHVVMCIPACRSGMLSLTSQAYRGLVP